MSWDLLTPAPWIPGPLCSLVELQVSEWVQEFQKLVSKILWFGLLLHVTNATHSIHHTSPFSLLVITRSTVNPKKGKNSTFLGVVHHQLCYCNHLKFN